MTSMTKIRVSHEDFDVSEEIAALEREGRNAGAVVTFTGVVRSDDGVTAMHLEHYPEMTEKSLAHIVEKARARWNIEDVVIIHRVGELKAGDRIVLTVVTSAHRREAFEASEFIMDWLKTEAPFWKKEVSLVLDAFASVSDVETLSGNRTSGRTDNVFNFFGRRRADDDGWRLAASFGAQRLTSVRLVCCHRRGFCGCQTIDGLVF